MAVALYTSALPAGATWLNWIQPGWNVGISPLVVFDPILNGFVTRPTQDAQLIVPTTGPHAGHLIRLIGPTLSIAGDFTAAAPLPFTGTITGIAIYDRYEDLLVFDDPNNQILTRDNLPWDGLLLAQVTGLSIDVAGGQGQLIAAIAAAFALGDDTVVGNIGDDLLPGGEGADIFFGAAGNDTIEGGGGEDTAVFTRASTEAQIRQTANGLEVTLDGTDLYRDVELFQFTDRTLTFAEMQALLNGQPTETADSLTGGAGPDTISGLGGNDTILGLDGNDLISGGHDDDFIGGGAGSDTIRGDDGNDTIYAGLGDDNVGGGAGNDVIYGSAGANVIYAGLGNDTVHGGSGSDTIYGSAGRNVLLGNGGNDRIQTSAGGDFAAGGAGNDTVLGAFGNDTIYAGLGNDFIGGGEGDDQIFAGAGTNRIYGGLGDDTIHAGTGRDVVTGGPGADVFVFASAAAIGIGAGRDVITDFTSGVDHIDLTALGTSFNGTAGLAGGGAKSFFYFAAGGLLIGDQNGDAVADWVIELTGAPAVAAGDFLL